MENQIKILLNLVLLLKSGRSGTCDLALIGGGHTAGAYNIASKISNWKEKYGDVHIVNVSSSGIYQTKSENLLELIE